MEIRQLALNITQKCDGGHVNCYVERTFYHLVKHVPYKPTSSYTILYEPLYTYNNGGDCKNTAILTKTLLNSLGFRAFIDCSVDDQHCVTVVPRALAHSLEEPTAWFVVDIAQEKMFTVYDKDDVWRQEDLG